MKASFIQLVTSPQPLTGKVLCICGQTTETFSTTSMPGAKRAQVIEVKDGALVAVSVQQEDLWWGEGILFEGPVPTFLLHPGSTGEALNFISSNSRGLHSSDD